MNYENNKFFVGIDYGISNSYIGIYMNGKAKIIHNKKGENSIPSIVYFKNENRILVGEEVLNEKIDNNKNLIYEVLRFIGLKYEEFIEKGLNKYYNYDVVNHDGIPKIKINLNQKEIFYSAEEISSLIIKKMIKCLEDYILEFNEFNIIISNIVITVPSYFNEDQKNSIRNSAKLAGIEESLIIFKHTAVSIAYELGNELISEKNNVDSRLFENLNYYVPISLQKIKKILSIDLDKKHLDVSIFNIRKNKEEIINVELEISKCDTFFGSNDFNDKLIDYCIKEYCKQTNKKEEKLKKEKISYERLKIKCETINNLLNIPEEVIIYIDHFLNEDNLYVKLSRDTFDNLYKNLYDKIKNIIFEMLDEISINPKDINEIFLIGEGAGIIGIKEYISKIFGINKIKDYINPREVIALGAALEASKIEKKYQAINLIDVIVYKIGIAVANPKPKDNEKNGLLMKTIIKKYSRIPVTKKKLFFSEINSKCNKINIQIYEGNDKYIKKNIFLGDIIVDNINTFGKIEYQVIFTVDINCQLTETIIIDSLEIKKEKIITKVTHGFADTSIKKIKVNKITNYHTRESLIEKIYNNNQKLTEINDIKNKLKFLIDICGNYEELIKIYMIFMVDNELYQEKIFEYSKKLFKFYIIRIKLKNKGENNIKEIIKKIKEGMKNFISNINYIVYLLDLFEEIKKDFSLKNEFYEIFTNFIELINDEGKLYERMENNNYYSKLYYEKGFNLIQKYDNENDLNIINKDIKVKFEKQKEINETELKRLNSSIFEKKSKQKKNQLENSKNYIIQQKFEKCKKDMNNLSMEEILEILDYSIKMADSFDSNENSSFELYCLANIILIKYQYFKSDFNDLWPYLNRLKILLVNLENENYDWINNLIKEIEINFIDNDE